MTEKLILYYCDVNSCPLNIEYQDSNFTISIHFKVLTIEKLILNPMAEFSLISKKM